MFRDQEESAVRDHSAKKTILLVEDDPGNGAFLVQAISQETPYQVLLITDSFRALEVVRHIKPNLFIIDYYLSTMNGIELYDQLHANSELEALPAIILSARFEEHLHEIEQRQLVGLSKPLELDELLATIEQLLG